MKIGILTLPLHTNYGGILQAYALQTVLERMGHEVIIYQKEITFKLPMWKYPFAYGKRILKKCFVDKRISILAEQKKKKDIPIVRKYVNQFIERYIHVQNINDIREINLSEIDAIVVGSDQIWRPLYVQRLWKAKIQDVFLQPFTDWCGIRMSYAASFGVDTWEYTKRETRDCSILLKKFDAISVREDKAVELCNKYLKDNPVQVLDPTLLLNAKDYIALIPKQNLNNRSRVLYCYLLDESAEKLNLINRIAAERKFKIEKKNIMVYNECIPVEEQIAPSVETWLQGFYEADFVVTDSFHGCVFSIIFKKPFVAIANKKRGMARFTSLLKMFGLENHLIVDAQGYSSNYSYNISDDSISEYGKWQKVSEEFIHSALKM